jgi:hypothetical protein
MKRNNAILEMLGAAVKYSTQPNTSWYKTKAASDELVLVDDAGKEQIGPLSRYSALMKSINFGSTRFVYVDKPDAQDARKKYHDYIEQESQSASSLQVGPSVQVSITKTASLAGPTELPAEGAQLTLDPSQPAVKSVQRESKLKEGAQDAI